MHSNVGKEVAALQRLTVKQLRAKYAEVFGEQTPAHNKAWLLKRIAWRLQALAEGDLSERARRRAAELACDADLRLNPPLVKPATATEEPAPSRVLHFHADGRLPPPGTVLTRKYKGAVLQVQVLPHGFEYEGEVFTSLSAVAKAITGSHCNGYLFFHLTNKGDRGPCPLAARAGHAPAQRPHGRSAGAQPSASRSWWTPKGLSSSATPATRRR
jgi:hypothetical protein